MLLQIRFYSHPRANRARRACAHAAVGLLDIAARVAARRPAYVPTGNVRNRVTAMGPTWGGSLLLR